MNTVHCVLSLSRSSDVRVCECVLVTAGSAETSGRSQLHSMLLGAGRHPQSSVRAVHSYPSAFF